MISCPHPSEHICLLPFPAEEERTWADTAEEEAELKLELAESLWDDLVTEMAQELLAMDRRALRRKSSGAVAMLDQPLMRAPRIPRGY